MKNVAEAESSRERGGDMSRRSSMTRAVFAALLALATTGCADGATVSASAPSPIPASEARPFVLEAPDRARVCYQHQANCDGSLTRQDARQLAAALNSLAVAKTEGHDCPVNARAVFVLATFFSGEETSTVTVGLPCANASNDKDELRALTDEVRQQLQEYASTAAP